MRDIREVVAVVVVLVACGLTIAWGASQASAWRVPDACDEGAGR